MKRIAVITGGSTGIGKEICRFAHAKGYRVGINFSSKFEDAKRSAFQLNKELENSFLLDADVRDENEVKKMMNNVRKQKGQPYLLVNNAGTIGKSMYFERMKAEAVDDVIKTNFYGTMFCSKYFFKLVRKYKKGSIINISSVVVVRPTRGQCHYIGSKAGIEGLTKSAAVEFPSEEIKIRVNAIAPGFVDTEMTRNLSEETKKLFINCTPLREIINPKHVAKAVLSIAELESLTGQVISVDGGFSLGYVNPEIQNDFKGAE